jgi:hypothetical protein
MGMHQCENARRCSRNCYKYNTIVEGDLYAIDFERKMGY